MVDDNENQDDYNPQNDNSGGGGGGNSGGGGGGGGLLSFLPLIFSLFSGGGGKKIILLLVVAAGAFFLFRNQLGGASGITVTIAKYATGGKLDPEQFKKASVYEGLSDDDAKNPLPERVSLLAYAPDRKDQGHQGSCVAWSSGYAARNYFTKCKLSVKTLTALHSAHLFYTTILVWMAAKVLTLLKQWNLCSKKVLCLCSNFLIPTKIVATRATNRCLH
ncbi:MAG: hypothetical protein WDM90_01705 [Ferruginibacter sp.]